MSKRVSRAAAGVVAKKYAKAVYGNRLDKQKEKLYAIAMRLYKKYIPLDFRNILDKYKKYYDGSNHLSFKCEGVCITVWFEGFSVLPNLRAIEISKEESDSLLETNDKKNELLRSSLSFERNATENFCKLKTWDNVVKYFPEIADYIPDEVEVLETSGIEELKNMAKAAKEGGEI